MTKIRMVLILTIVGLLATPAVAGTCLYRSEGMDSVRECTDGSVVVTGPRGRRVYGTPNGGFPREPGRWPPPPVYERR
jgi:hypothetical protein